MSQHKFTTTYDADEVVVQAGWDRPLSQFFMNIRYADENKSDAEGYAYTDLSDRHVRYDDWEYFRQVLVELKIEVPEGFHDSICADRENNRGNLMKNWDTGETIVLD